MALSFVGSVVSEDVPYSLVSKFRQCDNLGDSRVTESVIHGVSSFGGRSTCTGFSHKLIVYKRKPLPFFRFLEFRHFTEFRVDAGVLVQG